MIQFVIKYEHTVWTRFSLSELSLSLLKQWLMNVRAACVRGKYLRMNVPQHNIRFLSCCRNYQQNPSYSGNFLKGSIISAVFTRLLPYQRYRICLRIPHCNP
ncbi:hypothetical protein CEXT_705651 [Caerostris extrusa]|uniref:Uncharacterized protein n=1 Tax=Caerostris extrusa TaxID=172846 RepID=A0AAV4MPI6_CAEEX|nr:hypothetical protein CEXT_705651 [Caerostris extrusa]